MAGKIIETPEENFDTEGAMSFDDSNITGDYSDYDILKKEKELYPKWWSFGQIIKRGTEREGTFNSL